MSNIIPQETPAATKSGKRVRAPTDSPSPSASKRARRGRRRTSHADSISTVGDAISQMAAALTTGGALATPVRRRKALDLVAEDAEYSSDEEDSIIDLFSDHINVADTYSSIIKKSKRVKYVHGRLAKLAELSFA